MIEEKSEALICESHCSYIEAMKHKPDWFDPKIISQEMIASYKLLSRFMNWLHFKKHVKFMKIENRKFVFDDEAWCFYFYEFLGIKEQLQGKADLCERCAINRIVSYLIGSN